MILIYVFILYSLYLYFYKHADKVITFKPLIQSLLYNITNTIQDGGDQIVLRRTPRLFFTVTFKT